VAFINGKKVYNSQRLAAAARVEDRSVAEYTFLMSGTGDDWGRFEANPRVIVGSAYKNRPEVGEVDVARWLQIYEQVRGADEGDYGLVRFYVVEGVRYGEWTSYAGDSESQRKYHNCPEPPWSTHTHRGTCGLYGAAKAKVPTSAPPSSSIQVQVTGTGTGGGKPEGEPAAGTPHIYLTESSVSSVPTGSPETHSAAAARTRKEPAGQPGKSLTPEERIALESEGNTLVRHIHGATGEDQHEILAKASTGNGRYTGGRKVTWASMSDERVINTVIDLRERWAKVRPAEEGSYEAPVPAPSPDPAAAAVWQPIEAQLEKTVNRWAFGTWFRPLIPMSYVDEQLRVWTPNETFTRWITDNYTNHVRDAVEAAGMRSVRIEFGCFRGPPPAVVERKEAARVPGGRTQRPAENGRGG